MKTILITGATGFIGSYLTRRLVQKGGLQVRALRRKHSPMDLVASVQKDIEWFEGDVLDLPALEVAMKGVHQVYHAAAIVSFNAADHNQMRRINREGTANVVNLALDEGIEKLLHVSSIAAIGRSKNEQRIDENTKWQDGDANSGYAISKHLAEMEVWRGIAEGLNAVIVNPSNVLGSGFWEGRTATGQLFYKVWNGFRFYPQGTTGWVDVRDVVRFMVQLMESDRSGERYILSAENLPYKTIFDEIAKAINAKPPQIGVSPIIRESAWRAAWLLSKFTGKTPFITKETARSSARTYYYDNRKSLAAFDFSYTPVLSTIQETGQQFLLGANNGFPPAVLPFLE
jgi:nucleoside-diphosphate-sugar epimerase